MPALAHSRRRRARLSRRHPEPAESPRQRRKTPVVAQTQRNLDAPPRSGRACLHQVDVRRAQDVNVAHPHTQDLAEFGLRQNRLLKRDALRFESAVPCQARLRSMRNQHVRALGRQTSQQCRFVVRLGAVPDAPRHTCASQSGGQRGEIGVETRSTEKKEGRLPPGCRSVKRHTVEMQNPILVLQHHGGSVLSEGNLYVKSILAGRPASPRGG